jgi:hypothetical protein
MEESLKVIEQREVTFYDDELIAVRGDDGQVYVSIRHMCEALGLARQGQVRRIRDHNILSEGYKGGNVLLPPSPEGRGGGIQRMGLIRVDLVPLWLSGVRVKVAKEAIRPKLERFQREASKALWEAFQEGRLTADPGFEALLETDTPAVQAYKTFQALTKLARNQILLESRVDEHEERLERIESSLGDPGRAVTPDQASQVSQAVKGVAMILGKRSGRNEYGGVYGELYRREGITSYKLLPAHRFEAVMKWFSDWYKELSDGADVPF